MSLAGHNILIVDADKKAAKQIGGHLLRAGGNVFYANSEKQSLERQAESDMDILLCASSFLTGAGAQVVRPSDKFSVRPAPLVFGYGKESAQAIKKLLSRGILDFFGESTSGADMASRIGRYLFDPKKHFEQMSDADKVKQVSLVFQNAGGQWPLEVQQLGDEGLTGSLGGTFPEGQTGVLTVLFPDDERQWRFAVTVSRVEEGKENARIKISHKEKSRWQDFLAAIESRQTQIDDFLLMSSGR